VVPGDFDLDFQKICVRKARLAEMFNKVFVDSTAAICAGAKNRQLRQVVSDQFKSMADILGEISVDMSREPVLLPAETAAAKDVFENFGLETVFCDCMKTVSGRTCLTAELREIPKEIDFASLVSALRRALGIRFSFPAVTDSENGVTAVFDEKPTYRFELGAVQKTSGESKLCGDYFECFRNSDGSDMIVISDGMGTGGRAAVDSAMATNLFSTLIKAGLSCETSLKITNSALLAKSEEETLSTLDIAKLDPYSGTVDFYKAGGAPCFVRKGGRTAALEQVSLPAGILRDISFSTAQTNLSTGDILLMVSDGVLVDDGKWIHKILRSWNGNAQILAEYIAALAQKRRGNAKADDVTVICVTVEEI
ncbi:MAG: SpoIIE family protein phosphatase, partial [Oscillospiraceae bacterium]|nr:SpoIIE family protein phosphatase [Oscillospiraceae bacterium]